MKLLLGLLAVVAAAMVCGVVGLLVGATLGGNYAVDFQFNGARGYEATGQLGFLAGSIGGGVLSGLIVFTAFRK